jgi:hypothetical protein
MQRISIIVCFLFSLLFSCHNKKNNQNSKTDSLLQVNRLSKQDSLFNTNASLLIKPSATTLDSLQGMWISGKDHKDNLIIKEHDYLEIYKGSDGNDTTKSEIYFVDTCTGDDIMYSDLKKLNSKRENGKCLVLATLSDTSLNLCLEIDYLDSSHFSFFYHGKMSGFHRAK